MECPLKRLGATLFVAGSGSGRVIDSIAGNVKRKTEDTECNEKCAWYVRGKCAIWLIPPKE